MDEQRFWLVGNRGRVAVITDQAQAAKLASDGAYRCDGPFVPESELQGAVSLLSSLDGYVGHRDDCNGLSGAPDCSCGFDELYTQVRAVVRGRS